MAYGYGMSFGFDRQALVAVGGIGLGGVQVLGLSALQGAGMLGTPVLPSVFATNGELINGLLGIVGTGIGILGAMHKTSFLARHRDFALGSLTYGVTTLLTGWIVPMILRMVGQGTGAFPAGGGNQAGPIYAPGTSPTSPGAGANARFIAGLTG